MLWRLEFQNQVYAGISDGSRGESILASSSFWHSLTCRLIFLDTWLTSPCLSSYDLLSVHVCLHVKSPFFIRTAVILDSAHLNDLILKRLPLKVLFPNKVTFWSIGGYTSTYHFGGHSSTHNTSWNDSHNKGKVKNIYNPLTIKLRWSKNKVRIWSCMV